MFYRRNKKDCLDVFLTFQTRSDKQMCNYEANVLSPEMFYS